MPGIPVSAPSKLIFPKIHCTARLSILKCLWNPFSSCLCQNGYSLFVFHHPRTQNHWAFYIYPLLTCLPTINSLRPIYMCSCVNRPSPVSDTIHDAYSWLTERSHIKKAESWKSRNDTLWWWRRGSNWEPSGWIKPPVSWCDNTVVLGHWGHLEVGRENEGENSQ